MSLPQTANMLSVKTSLHYYHNEDDTKYYAAYTGKSGNSSGKLYNKNVKAYTLLYNGDTIDFKNLEIVEIWCKDLSERDWRKLNPEVVDSMCCLLNPAPGLYKIHFFNKKGNTNAQAFTYSTMIFRIILHCEQETGVWQGTLPIRINTRSSALKSVWRKETKVKANTSSSSSSSIVTTSNGNKSRSRSEDEDSDDDMQDANDSSPLSTGTPNGSLLNDHHHHQQHHHNPLTNSMFPHSGQLLSMQHHQHTPIMPSFNRAPMPSMISTDDMIIGGGEGNTSGDEDELQRQRHPSDE